MDNGYLVKFKNYEYNIEGTGKLHYEVLSEKGRCIWGQWTANGNPMYETTFKRMNQEVPFYLYALDNAFALLKMRVERVLTKEEVCEEKLENLIPDYYSVDTPCASYYLISNIEIYPPEEGSKVIITNSGNTALNINQINSRSPIKVHWDQNSNLNIPLKQINRATACKPPVISTPIEEDINTEDKNYVVYRYQSKIDNKCYIGLTGNLEQRINHHKNSTNWRSNKEKWKILYIMFSMYGYDNYEFSILHENLTKEEACYWEAKEIENHNCYYPNGFNVRDESRHLNPPFIN